MEAFCVLCISSFNCVEDEVNNVRYTILDSDNVLKIFIFPYSVTFLNPHKFKTFCMLVMLFTFVFVFVTFEKKYARLRFL